MHMADQNQPPAFCSFAYDKAEFVDKTNDLGRGFGRLQARRQPVTLRADRQSVVNGVADARQCFRIKQSAPKIGQETANVGKMLIGLKKDYGVVSAQGFMSSP